MNAREELEEIFVSHIQIVDGLSNPVIFRHDVEKIIQAILDAGFVRLEDVEIDKGIVLHKLIESGLDREDITTAQLADTIS